MITTESKLKRYKRNREEYYNENIKGGILIKNLVGKLEEINKNAIRDFFSSFGTIEKIDLEINPETGKHKGFALVLFKRKEDAKIAIKKMNGYLISGVPIIVTEIPNNMQSYLIRSNNEGYNKLEMKTARDYFISKIQKDQYSKKIEGDKIDPDEERTKNLREDVFGHKYFREEISKTLGLFNLYGFLKGSLKEQRVFLEELKEDVKCKFIR